MLTAMGDVLRKCYERGWITTRDGNVSLRQSLDGKISSLMYITPKGVRKTTIHPEHIIKLHVNGVAGMLDVSTEFHMHRNLLVDANVTRCVLHVHATHVVAAMFAGWDLQELAKKFPEISKYTKVGPTVGFFNTGTLELANATNLAFRGNLDSKIQYDIVGQESHGVCAVGKSPWDAYEHIERLDHIAQIVLASGVKPG